jgi:RNA polymerase sigma factor (sigma-70 family)
VVEAGQRDQRTTLRDYLRVVRRRKWIILQAVVLVPLAAVAFSLQQQKLYRANADVLLVQQNLGTQLNGITDPTIYQQPDRKAQTQADLARSPDVARQALDVAGLRGRSTQDLLSHSSVAAKQNADLLPFSVTDRNPAIAARLANAYGRAYIDYRAKLDTAALLEAKRDVNARIKALTRGSASYEALVEKGNTVDTMIALASKPAVLIDRASGAAQVQPRPVRNGILAGVLGIVLGIGLAYAYTAYRLGDGPDAEDATSETFERALRYRESYDRHKGEPLAWLIGIARRVVDDQLSVRYRPSFSSVPEIAAADDVAADALDRLELARALDKLDARARELIALRCGADLTTRQIAELLELRTNTAAVALHRALGQLRRDLEEPAPAPGLRGAEASASSRV